MRKKSSTFCKWQHTWQRCLCSESRSRKARRPCSAQPLKHFLYYRMRVKLTESVFARSVAHSNDGEGDEENENDLKEGQLGREMDRIPWRT